MKLHVSDVAYGLGLLFNRVQVIACVRFQLCQLAYYGVFTCRHRAVRGSVN